MAKFFCLSENLLLLAVNVLPRVFHKMDQQWMGNVLRSCDYIYKNREMENSCVGLRCTLYGQSAMGIGLCWRTFMSCMSEARRKRKLSVLD